VTDAAEPATIGPFHVLRKLGEGGMGVVYAGYDVALDRKVALKLIRRQLVSSNEMHARMIREAQAMARLSHPNVVQVYQVGQHDDEIYMAMEYVEGATLTAWLQRGAPAVAAGAAHGDRGGARAGGGARGGAGAPRFQAEISHGGLCAREHLLFSASLLACV
jgi:hypothetical protein